MDTEWEDANRLRQVLGHGEIMTGIQPGADGPKEGEWFDEQEKDFVLQCNLI